MKTWTVDGVRLRMNAELLSRARREHFWVPLERFPSGHVIVETAAPSREVLGDAAARCLAHTKYRHLRNATASATTIANLRVVGEGEVEFVRPRRVQRVPCAASENSMTASK